MTRPAVVDSDGHILEPPDLWERYLEPKYRERAIRFCVDSRGWEYVEINGSKSKTLRGGALGALGGAYQDPRELLTPGKLTYWEVAKRTPGAIDPDARVREMDAEVIDAAILYPTIGIIWEGDCDDVLRVADNGLGPQDHLHEPGGGRSARDRPVRCLGTSDRRSRVRVSR